MNRKSRKNVKTKKLIVRLHSHAVVRYTGDLIVEAPEDMCECCIRRMVWSNANELPDPDWIGNDRNGRNTVYTDDTDELPEIVGLASSHAEATVTFVEDQAGDVHMFSGGEPVGLTFVPVRKSPQE